MTVDSEAFDVSDEALVLLLRFVTWRRYQLECLARNGKSHGSVKYVLPFSSGRSVGRLIIIGAAAMLGVL